VCKLERGKGMSSFLKRSAGRMSGLVYGEPRMELGEVNVFC